MKRLLILLVPILWVAACGAPANIPESTPDPAADRAEIDKLRNAFVAAYNEGSAENVGATYSDDAVYMPSEQPTLHGRAAIIAHNKAFFEQFTVKATLVPEQTEVFGDHAFDRGTYTVEWTPKKGGKPETAEGRFLVVLRRRADGWKVIADIDNEPAAKK